MWQVFGHEVCQLRWARHSAFPGPHQVNERQLGIELDHSAGLTSRLHQEAHRALFAVDTQLCRALLDSQREADTDNRRSFGRDPVDRQCHGHWLQEVFAQSVATYSQAAEGRDHRQNVQELVQGRENRQDPVTATLVHLLLGELCSPDTFAVRRLSECARRWAQTEAGDHVHHLHVRQANNDQRQLRHSLPELH